MKVLASKAGLKSNDMAFLEQEMQRRKEEKEAERERPLKNLRTTMRAGVAIP